MKKFLKLTCISLLVSIWIIATQTAGLSNEDLAEDSVRWLSNRESFTVERFLFADELIAVACDRDCYGVGLSLSADRLTAETDAQTPNPSLRAPYEGTFSIGVTMQNCAREGGCRTWIYLEDETAG